MDGMRTMAYIIIIVTLALSQPAQIVVTGFQMFTEALRMIVGGG